MIHEVVRLPSHILVKTLKRKGIDVAEDIERFDLISMIRDLFRTRKIKKEDFDKEIDLFLEEKKNG